MQSAVHARFTMSLLLAFVALHGCGEANNPPLIGRPAVMNIVSGDEQSGTAGEELVAPLVVRVVDEDGDPVASQVVNFRVLAGGGSVFAGVAITNANGEARERWTLGTVAGQDQAVQARAIDAETGAALVFADFIATAAAGPPTTIVAIAGSGQTVAAGSRAADSLVVVLRDEHANPVPGATVSWSVASGMGQLDPATSVTNAAGEARTSWTVGPSTSTPQQVVAVIGSLSAPFSASAVSGPATRLEIVRLAEGALAGPPFSQQPVVQLADALGNTVTTSSAIVTMTVSGGATVSGTGSRSASAGVASFVEAGLLGTAGTYSLTFTASVNGSPLGVSQDIVLGAGPVTSYAITTSASSAAVNTAFQVQAQAKDVSGNSVRAGGRVLTWSRTGNGGAFAAPTSGTDANGVATTTFTVAQTLTSTSVSVIGTDASSATGQASVTISPAAPTKLLFVNQPADAGYATIIAPVTVRVVDEYDNIIPSDTRTVQVAIGSGEAGATLTGTTSVAAASGVATFDDLSLDIPGTSYTLTASASGLTAATSVPFPVVRVGVVIPTSSLPADDFFSALALGPSAVFLARFGGRVCAVGCGTHPGYVERIPLRGGTRTLLRQYPLSQYEPERLVLDDNALRVLRRNHPCAGTGLSRSCVETVDATTGSVVHATEVQEQMGTDLESDGVSVYVRNHIPSNPDTGGGVVKISSGTATRIVRGVSNSVGNYPSLLHADDFLYFVNAGDIVRAPSAGGSLTVLVANAEFARHRFWVVRAMVIAAGSLYYVGTGGRILKVPASGGTPMAVVTGLAEESSGCCPPQNYSLVHHLTPDGDWMYFIEAGSIKRFSMANPSVIEVFARDEGASDLSIDGTAVYWVGTGGLKKAPK